MFFDDAVDQGQAESGALVGSFGGIEGLENMIELVFGNPGTLVGDLDDSGVSLAVSTDADQPALGEASRALASRLTNTCTRRCSSPSTMRLTGQSFW